jgi:TRAP-type mannitol/chloroaromatic compound transport system permease small subunit
MLKKIINFINTLSEWSGQLIAWLILLMVLTIIYDVGTRFFLDVSSVGLQELQWHIFALIFLLGAAYTLKHDGHVRVDIIYQSRWMNDRQRAWVNLFGGIFILIPFCTLVIYASFPFVYSAFLYHENSPDPGGLPHRFLLKGAIPLGFFMILLQGIALSLESLLFLFNNQKDK